MRKFLLLLLTFILNSQIANAQVGLFIRPNSSSLSSPVSGQTWLFNSSANTIQVFNGSSFSTVSAPKNNFTATLAPTSANDQTQGYTTGSQWYNTSTQIYYSCVSAATSAAVWVQLNNLGSGTIALSLLAQDSATTGQSLLWNGMQWAPGNPLISLSNVLQTGALIGQIPVWNGTNWVPVSLQNTGGTNLPTYITVNNETATLPNSSKLVAGSGITLTPSTNTLTIAASGGGALPGGGSDNKIISYASGAGGWYNGLSTVSALNVTTGATLTVNSPSCIRISPVEDQIIRLPVASTCLGKMFTIVQDTTITGYSTTIEGQGSDTIEAFNGNANTPFVSNLTMGGFGHGAAYSAPVTLISDGVSAWHQLAPPQQIVANGQLSLPVHNQSSNFSANFGELDLVTLNSSNITCTLPDATLFPGQQIIVVLNQGSSSSFSLIFATTSSQLINGSNFWYGQGFNGGTAATIFTFVSNGTNWNATIGGDMLNGLWNGPNNGATEGQFASCTNNNTIQLQPLLAPHNINSNSTAYGQNAYFVDTSGGNVVVTLCDAPSHAGQMITVTCVGTGNNVTFDSTSGQTINGSAATEFTNLTAIGSSVTFVSDGSNWWCTSNTFGGVGP